MTEQKPLRYDAFKAKAEKLLDSPIRLQKLLAQATHKLAAQGSHGIKEATDDLRTALALKPHAAYFVANAKGLCYLLVASTDGQRPACLQALALVMG